MRYKGLKGKAWESCRKYICARDGYKCVTCGRRKEDGWVVQAGHYQPVGFVGSNNKLSWDETNIYCQCAYCNGPGQGQQELMAKHILKVHGQATLDSIKSRVRKLDPVKDWQAMKKHYDTMLAELERLDN